MSKTTIFTMIFSKQTRTVLLNIGLTAALSAPALLLSCAGLSKGKTEFERFSVSFSQEADKAEQAIEKYSALAEKLSEYEKRVGNLSDNDYANIEELLSNISNAKNEMDLQTQKAKDIGKSITAEGYYATTNEKVRGWDAMAYTDMHIDAKLSALNQTSREARRIYDSIDLNLLKKPNKPFNANATKLITQATIEVDSVKSDVAIKDWASGQNAVERANDTVKNALRLELNNIEHYQIMLLQDELRKLSSVISLGSTLNKAGSIIEDAAKGAVGILGGIGGILKGVGEKLSQ
jgi:hypothetical protein